MSHYLHADKTKVVKAQGPVVLLICTVQIAQVFYEHSRIDSIKYLG